jgi:hypothetical protein
MRTPLCMTRSDQLNGTHFPHFRSSNWGFGRLLRETRDGAEAAAVADQGKGAGWPTVAADAFANGRVRFSNCENSAVGPAVYVKPPFCFFVLCIQLTYE